MSTVTVGCKIPNGVKISAANKEAVVAGPRPPAPGAPHPVRPGGYEFTDGVDADLWTRWVEAHADADMVTKKLIFAAATRDEATGLAYVYGRNNPSGLAQVARS